MARNIVRKDAAPKSVEAGEAPAASTEPMPLVVGGTSGAPPDPNPRSVVIHGINDVAPAPHVDSDRPAVRQRRWRVVDGPDQVMYDGQRMVMRRGKIYTEGSVDIEFLEQQGVRFEELKDEAAA